uniref:Transposase Tc1-like domain-containing protein n=1 Tax=Paramormyrops kingsleyae TaxID=1676925 RepID=A0A3B3QPZ1_9TELE
MQLPSMWGMQSPDVANQWAREGTHTHCEGSGRLRRTAPREDRCIVRQASQNPMTSVPAIRTQVLDSVQHSMSSHTMSRRLALAGLPVHHPMCRLPLTPAQRQLCLEWCRKPEAWTDDKRCCTMFSVESQFCIKKDDRRVWRCRGERTNPGNIVEKRTSVIPSIMVWRAIEWGAIEYDFRSSLVVIHGTLMSQRHVSDILRLHVLPLLRQHTGTVHQDNASPHTAQVFMDYELSPWPARSPNLSPIEHIWDQAGRYGLKIKSPIFSQKIRFPILIDFPLPYSKSNYRLQKWFKTSFNFI